MKTGFQEKPPEFKLDNTGSKNAQKGRESHPQKVRNTKESARCPPTQVFTKNHATFFTKGGRHFLLSKGDTSP